MGGFEGHRMGGPGGRHGFGGGDHLARMAENPRVRQYLGLTDDQVARLHKIGIDAEKTSVQVRADMEMRHIELRELMRAENPNESAIMQKLDEVNSLRGKIEKQRVQTMLAARGVLTPEQRQKVKTFMEHRGEGGGPGRGPGMQHHGGMGHPPGQHAGPGGGPGAPPANPQAPPNQ
jgi:Spy/CpxP family protein refolding chaperone